MSLQRLVLDFRTGELVVRCLYCSKGDSNPGTKGRRREVLDLARGGLGTALEALEGCSGCCRYLGIHYPRRCFLMYYQRWRNPE